MVKHVWTDDDYDYLVQLYRANIQARNRVYAAQCTEHFGRPVTENAIRGALHRLRIVYHKISSLRNGSPSVKRGPQKEKDPVIEAVCAAPTEVETPRPAPAWAPRPMKPERHYPALTREPEPVYGLEELEGIGD